MLWKGDPIAEVESLRDAYLVQAREFMRRWPKRAYTFQEAGARGFSIVGTPEMTPEEARQLRAQLDGRTEEREHVVAVTTQAYEDGRESVLRRKVVDGE